MANDLFYGDIDDLRRAGNALKTKAGISGTIKVPEWESIINRLNVSGGTIRLQEKTSTPSTTSQTVVADSGYAGLSKVTVAAMPAGTAGTPTAAKGTVSNHSVSITPSVTNTAGYIPSGTKTGTAVSVSASELVSGTLSVTTNGEKDVTNYQKINVNIATSGPAPSTQSKSIAPTEEEQTVYPDSNYLLSSVTVDAIPSTYVASGVTRKTSSDLTVNGATVNVPAGYYSAKASKSVASGSAGVPVAIKGTVSNHSVSVTPSVTNTTGYINGSTIGGTAVTVSASELVSGTLDINVNGEKDVTNYQKVNVNIAGAASPLLQSKTVTPSTSSQTVSPDSGFDALSSVTVNAMPTGALGTVSATKGTVSNHQISVTPKISGGTAGYISATSKNGTAVTVSASELVSGNKEIVANGSNIDVTNYATVSVDVPSSGTTINNQNKTVTLSETEQSISADSGYTGLGTVTVPGISSTYVGSGVAKKSSTDLTVSGATVTVPAGYYASQATKSVATGSISVDKPTINTSTGVVTASTTLSTAGYIGTNPNSNTLQLTTQAAATITPSSSSQTAVAAGKYTTGAVTVAAVPTETKTIDANGTFSPTSGKFFSSVTVNIPIQTYYTGSTAPASSLGANGDLYLKV